VRRIQEIKPIKILKTPGGDTVVDMGQNMVGWVRLKAQGPAGNTVTLRHAEVLDKQGNFYTENLRAAKAALRTRSKAAGRKCTSRTSRSWDSATLQWTAIRVTSPSTA
jgi:alpha-L-rhamnosidase